MDGIDEIRSSTEGRLSRVLRGMNARNRRRVLAAIDEYGSVEAIPDAFWEGLRQEADERAAEALLLLLIAVYSTETRRFGSSVNRETARTAAALTAARMGRDVANDYVGGVRNRLVTNIDRRANELNGMAPREASIRVRQVIDDVLDEDQIDLTVSTITTRAVTIAQQSAGDDEGVRRGGVVVEYRWVTERDARVCPICAPLDGQLSTDWEEITARTQTARTVREVSSGPPAHPRCRCRLDPVIAPVGEAA